MRKELELMETIDKYLKWEMSEADRTAFEKKMNADPSLKKEVELQQQLLKGIERTGLKQSAKQGLKKYKFNRNLRNWGLTGLSVAVIALSSVFVYNAVTKTEQKENAAYELPELNEQGEKLWADADRYLPTQVFELDTEKDTVVETEDGIVIAIPAHSFLDASGKPATGTVDLEVREAINADDIMRAGLSTKSGDQLLETGGMFYINARQDGTSLKIDPKNSPYAEIPTDEIKPNMQLFEGKRLADGSIDWVNPKPIRKDLIPVDITSLNFYPPSYLDSLKGWGYNSRDKKFTDSLYYSFASQFGIGSLISTDEDFSTDDINTKDTTVSVTRKMASEPTNRFERGGQLFRQNCAVCHSMGTNKITGPGLNGVMARVPSEKWLKMYIKNNDAMVKSGDPYAVKIAAFDASQMTIFNNLTDDELNILVEYIKEYDPSVAMSRKYFSDSLAKGINPAQIKAIWNEQFNNTLLATREFEERLPMIHRTCDGNVLDTYISNLNKDLSAIDSAVMKQYPEFAAFAARGDGKVKNGNKNVEMLKRYYEMKSKAYTEAISKTVNEFWNTQYSKDREARDKTVEQANNEAMAKMENFQQELNLNLDNAFQQLGMKRPAASTSTSVISTGGSIPPSYGTPVTNTGWCNIDRATENATITRTTLDFKDAGSGKTAVIKYEELGVKIAEQNKYDRVLVYLLPNELTSFMRMNQNGGTYTEKLNELITYKLVCIAYKGEESFYYSQDNVKPGTISVSMVKTTNAIITNNVNKFGKMSHVKAMNDELAFIAFEKEEAKRQAFVTKVSELRSKIAPVIFPCGPVIMSADTVNLEWATH